MITITETYRTRFAPNFEYGRPDYLHLQTYEESGWLANGVRGGETKVDAVLHLAQDAVEWLDAALERAHDTSGYDTAVAVRDAAQSLSGGLAATVMEADALVAELDALAERGGPQSDTDDPAYAGYKPINCRCAGPPYILEPEQQEVP